VFLLLPVALAACSSPDPDVPLRTGPAETPTAAAEAPASAEPRLSGARRVEGDLPVLPAGRSADGSRRARVLPSPDGSYARLLVTGGDGSGERVVLGVPGRLGEPAFHPDGRRLVFSADFGLERNRDLYLVNDDGTDLVRLTRHPAADEDPAFTPDGSRLVWSSARWDGTPRLTVAGFTEVPPAAGGCRGAPRRFARRRRRCRVRGRLLPAVRPRTRR
jgi:TolB protein